MRVIEQTIIKKIVFEKNKCSDHCDYLDKSNCYCDKYDTHLNHDLGIYNYENVFRATDCRKKYGVAKGTDKLDGIL